jgi:hypothetical protein
MGINVDAIPGNADWLKGAWDMLPPYKSDEFFATVWPKEQLDGFRKLPVYKLAVERGLIVDDEWVGYGYEK